jgi:hypothetical protein
LFGVEEDKLGDYGCLLLFAIDDDDEGVEGRRKREVTDLKICSWPCMLF